MDWPWRRWERRVEQRAVAQALSAVARQGSPGLGVLPIVRERSTARPPLSVKTFRELADRYDVLRACIEHLKRELRAVPVQLIGPSEARSAEAERLLLGRSGPLGGRQRFARHFLDEVIEDALIVGHYAVFLDRDESGVSEITALDADTIRPRLDERGWPDPIYPYEQFIHGVSVRKFRADELIVDGLHPATHRPYFRSRIEFLVHVVLSALKADEWNRSWLTDGNMPDQFIAVPRDWTPTQLREYAAYFDAMLETGAANRRRAKIVPEGTRPIWSQSRKDADFQAFERWLMQRTCAVMGVQGASIGFVGEQYKVTQAASMRATSQFGVADLMVLRRDLYGELLRALGFWDVEVREQSQAPETPLERAQRLKIETGRAWKQVAEARRECGLMTEEEK